MSVSLVYYEEIRNVLLVSIFSMTGPASIVTSIKLKNEGVDR